MSEHEVKHKLGYLSKACRCPMMIGRLVTCSRDTSTGSPFIQEIEHLSDEGADVLALNTAATFKMLGLIWQSLISSVPLHVLNLVERKRKRVQAAQGGACSLF